jgi:hypothetical protein
MNNYGKFGDKYHGLNLMLLQNKICSDITTKKSEYFAKVLYFTGRQYLIRTVNNLTIKTIVLKKKTCAIPVNYLTSVLHVTRW